jgi:3-oxoacyl-[acyl-carrier protein] reductase
VDLKINGKTALVTGAGRGLGEGICHSLAREGVRIIACSRTESDLITLVRRLPPDQNHQYIALDLAKSESVSELIDYIQRNDWAPDIIVNNVGGNLGYTDPLGGVDQWQQVMALNVEVAIALNRMFIPKMQEKRWGRICHVSSISALENQGPPAYCAAKAALNAYVRSLGRYVSPDNVILTSVMPGAVYTEGGYWDLASRDRPAHVEKYLSERMAIKRFGTVDEISEVVTFLCSDLSSFCVGSCFLVDGGQGKVFYPS